MCLSGNSSSTVRHDQGSLAKEMTAIFLTAYIKEVLFFDNGYNWLEVID